MNHIQYSTWKQFGCTNTFSKFIWPISQICEYRISDYILSTKTYYPMDCSQWCFRCNQKLHVFAFLKTLNAWFVGDWLQRHVYLIDSVSNWWKRLWIDRWFDALTHSLGRSGEVMFISCALEKKFNSEFQVSEWTWRMMRNNPLIVVMFVHSRPKSLPNRFFALFAFLHVRWSEQMSPDAFLISRCSNLIQNL